MDESLKKNIIFWLIPLILLFLWYFKEIIIPFLAGVIIGSAIQSLAFYLSYRLKINYYLGVTLIYLFSIFLIITTFYLTIKVLIEELPPLLEKIQPYLSLVKNLNIKAKWTDILSLSDYLPNILRLLSYFFGGLLSLILIFVISLYISLAKNFPEDFFSFLKFKEEDFKTWRRVRRKISFWFLGQIILMTFIGLATYIFVSLILKVKYALLISLVAGLLEFVPILGPIITLVITSIIVFLENPNYILLTIVFFILLQQFENHFLVPIVMKKATALNPLLVILGILVGAKIGGILGIIIIIPILGSVIEVLKIRRISELTECPEPEQSTIQGYAPCFALVRGGVMVARLPLEEKILVRIQAPQQDDMLFLFTKCQGDRF
jgi:predicted PurR-regulated permease PerM